jgi:ABC-type sulfate/molybdate transport systems ATPase subunit
VPDPYLDIDIEQRLGELLLQVRCAFSASWTVLFGPSGAGKTSLLRLIAGLSKPDRGQIVLHGKTLKAVPAARGIGFVTQRPALFPHMNVTANVSFGLSRMGRSARDRVRGDRVEEMLELFQARHLASRMPAQLSGGEKQRVALARALAPEPRLLLLDEPFTGIDAGLKAEILERLTTLLAKKSIPALYVSHDVAEAFQTQADVAVMSHGQIQALGPASTVLAAQRKQLLEQLGSWQD